MNLADLMWMSLTNKLIERRCKKIASMFFTVDKYPVVCVANFYKPKKKKNVMYKKMSYKLQTKSSNEIL